MIRMRQIVMLCVVMLAGLVPFMVQAKEGEFVPRKLVTFYDGRYEYNLRQNTVHRFLGMPANWLGYDIHFYDINKPLPELDADTHGIILWFHHEPIPQAEAFTHWLAKQMRAGKHLVVMEGMGLGKEQDLSPETLRDLQYIRSRIGIREMGGWQALTHKSRIVHLDNSIADFEREIRSPLPPYEETVVSAEGVSYLRVAHEGTRNGYADLIITGPQGGYVASGYAYHEQSVKGRVVSMWLINPFEFLRRSLEPELYPIPDVTTRAGRRIFYAHIDGDGWNSQTLIEKYRDTVASSMDVIDWELIEPYKDFTFTVGLVAGDFTDNCFGSDASRTSARRILARPNVEPANHTYTHPFYWEFFEDYTPEAEEEFMSSYPRRRGLLNQSFLSFLKSDDVAEKHPHRPDGVTPPTVEEMKKAPMLVDIKKMQREEMEEMYERPRAYNCIPYDEDKEIHLANEIIESLAPADKKSRLVQWPGNTSPYPRYLRKVREAGMVNINGGESRYDDEYPSYSSLFPIGITFGGERQIYSTASNENTYTNLWSERFFGYRYLIKTVQHTESPRRLAPFNVYFHAYSGERPGSMAALKEIMEYARGQELIPIFTTHYADIATGFFDTRVEVLGKWHWRIHNRGELQTLRMALPAHVEVDMERSKGVLGWRNIQDKIYIFLNPNLDKPEIMLHEVAQHTPPPRMRLYSSRWDILSATREGKTAISLELLGFGKGEMEWIVPVNGRYGVELSDESGKRVQLSFVSDNHRLRVMLGEEWTAHKPLKMRIFMSEKQD